MDKEPPMHDDMPSIHEFDYALIILECTSITE